MAEVVSACVSMSYVHTSDQQDRIMREGVV